MIEEAQLQRGDFRVFSRLQIVDDQGLNWKTIIEYSTLTGAFEIARSISASHFGNVSSETGWEFRWKGQVLPSAQLQFVLRRTPEGLKLFPIAAMIDFQLDNERDTQKSLLNRLKAEEEQKMRVELLPLNF